MNITKMVKDGVNSIGDTINPFPKKIEVVVKFDIAGTYGDAITALNELTPERMLEITEIFKRKQRQIMDLIDKEDKWGYSVN